MYRMFLAGLVGVLFTLAPTGTPAAQEVTLRYAHPTSTNSNGGLRALKFKEKLEQLSGGTMAVRIFPDGQLGRLSEMNELVASGSIQVSANTWGSLSTFVAEAGALDSPYLFRDPQQLHTILTHPNSKIIPTLNEALAQNRSGLTIVAASGSSARQVTCKKAVRSPADLAGVRFRAIPFPVFIATVRGMGAIPVPVEYAELTTALATGLVDCQENPLTNIFHDKLYESQSHIMMTNHIIGGGPTLMNSAFLARLTPRQRDWIKEAAQFGANESFKAVLADEEELIRRLKAMGKIFIGPEDGLQVDVFAQRVQAEIRRQFEGRYDRMLAMVEAEKATLGK